MSPEPYAMDVDPDRFAIERASVAEGVELAFVRRGEGGYPLLLVHGWPETKRIWWRNIEPLAEAGFEVIVPDLRGFADSGLAPDGFYDPATQATDLYRLVHDVLGHERCAAAGGDFGGVIIEDMGLRFEGLIERQVLFNTIPPVGLQEQYEAAGVAAFRDARSLQASDYFFRQANYADVVASELDTPDKRRRYVATFYGPRFWAAPGTFDQEAVEFMAEPFGDEVSFRSSIAIYESALGKRAVSEPPLWFGSGSDLPTLILYGPEDHVIPSSFPDRCAVAFPEHVGPFFVPDAGHFLQWERASVLNQAIKHFCLDLLGDSDRNG
jgi:pimeloyl-ACP methyl ester carboxylesterase